MNIEPSWLALGAMVTDAIRDHINPKATAWDKDHMQLVIGLVEKMAAVTHAARIEQLRQQITAGAMGINDLPAWHPDYLQHQPAGGQ